MTPAELAKWIEVSDDDVKAAYEEQHARLRHAGKAPHPADRLPEHGGCAGRADEASRAARALAAVAAERGLKEQDTDLGTVAKTGIIDPAVAEAAFALKEGEVSAPVKGRFGAVLVTVRKIEPEPTQAVRGGRAADRATRSRSSAPKPGQRSARQDRGRSRRRRDAGTGGEEVEAAGRHHRASTAPAAIRTASRSPMFRTPPTSSAPPSPPTSASTTTRSRPTAATSGMRSPTSRRRTSARSTKSRIRSSSAGATTRSPRG